jgi:hypothetical protein
MFLPPRRRDPVTDTTQLAKEAYLSYGEVTGFLNYQGLPMPRWGELPEKIQEAWVAAASTVYFLAREEQ